MVLPPPVAVPTRMGGVLLQSPDPDPHSLPSVPTDPPPTGQRRLPLPHVQCVVSLLGDPAPQLAEGEADRSAGTAPPPACRELRSSRVRILPQRPATRPGPIPQDRGVPAGRQHRLPLGDAFWNGSLVDRHGLVALYLPCGPSTSGVFVALLLGLPVRLQVRRETRPRRWPPSSVTERSGWPVERSFVCLGRGSRRLLVSPPECRTPPVQSAQVLRPCTTVAGRFEGVPRRVNRAPFRIQRLILCRRSHVFEEAFFHRAEPLVVALCVHQAHRVGAEAPRPPQLGQVFLPEADGADVVRPHLTERLVSTAGAGQPASGGRRRSALGAHQRFPCRFCCFQCLQLG